MSRLDLLLCCAACADSVPNTVMPLVGGMIIDRLGARFAAQLFSAVMVLGACLLWAVLSLDLQPGSSARVAMMVASMVVFGIGGESTTVAQKALLASWFKEAEGFPRLSFATGLTLVFGYLAIVANR